MSYNSFLKTADSTFPTRSGLNGDRMSCTTADNLSVVQPWLVLSRYCKVSPGVTRWTKARFLLTALNSQTRRCWLYVDRIEMIMTRLKEILRVNALQTTRLKGVHVISGKTVSRYVTLHEHRQQCCHWVSSCNLKADIDWRIPDSSFTSPRLFFSEVEQLLYLMR